MRKPERKFYYFMAKFQGSGFFLPSFESKHQGSGFSFQILISKIQGRGFSFQFFKNYHNFTVFLE